MDIRRGEIQDSLVMVVGVTKIATVLFDEYHSESWTISRARAAEIQPENPANSSYQTAANALTAREFRTERNTGQPITAELLQDKDVLVFLHPCEPRWEASTSSNSPRLTAEEIRSIHEFVSRGGGLLVISEYEHDKYGDNLNDLLGPLGLEIQNTTVTDRDSAVNEEKTHVLGVMSDHHARGLLVGVRGACFYRTGTCAAADRSGIAISTSPAARPPSAGLVAVAQHGLGRVAVVTDSDLFGDDHVGQYDHLQLWLNLFYWLAERAFVSKAPAAIGGGGVGAGESWQLLRASIEALRALHVQRRQPDNSYRVETINPDAIRPLVDTITGCVRQLIPRFPADARHLEMVIEDLQAWQRGGYQKPDFSRALDAFQPHVDRAENAQHLAVLPLYTPNHSLDIHFEAVIFRVPWSAWLAEIARGEFRNDKFVPGHLVDYTAGYDSECAVLFPETVSVEGTAPNRFGVIFCDREAKRYQKCVRRCIELTQLNSGPDLTCFLGNLGLVADAFAMWDLVHDASHSKGHLPFDPFMVRQLHPYWMYSLEELRVDLRSVKAASKMMKAGFPFGKTIAYGVLFDRIFRFAISGSREKNYDGLAGQLLFAALHKKKALSWDDNRLTVAWEKVLSTMEELGDEIEHFYDEGADHSRIRRSVEGHRFISKYVPPSFNSRWQNPTAMGIPENEVRKWIEKALDDEFPLGSFHAWLKKMYEGPTAARAAGSKGP